jgi:hypothetical protein
MKTSLTWNQITADGRIALHSVAPAIPLRSAGTVRENREKVSSLPKAGANQTGTIRATQELSQLWLKEVREIGGLGWKLERLFLGALASSAIVALVVGTSSSLSLVHHWQNFARLVQSFLF